MEGMVVSGEVAEIDIINAGSASSNYAFDITPARLVTERPQGCPTCASSENI